MTQNTGWIGRFHKKIFALYSMYVCSSGSWRRTPLIYHWLGPSSCIEGRRSYPTCSPWGERRAEKQLLPDKTCFFFMEYCAVLCTYPQSDNWTRTNVCFFRKTCYYKQISLHLTVLSDRSILAMTVQFIFTCHMNGL